MPLCQDVAAQVSNAQRLYGKLAPAAPKLAYRYVPCWGTSSYVRISVLAKWERTDRHISVCSLLGNVSVRAYQYVPCWGAYPYEHISMFPIEERVRTSV